MIRDISVVQVINSRMLKDFIQLPWKIYRDDPHWVPPLFSEMKKKLNPKVHPFFKHSQVALFLAYYRNKPVGRIAAIIDFNHNNFHKDKVGFFGLFECVEHYGIAELLLDRAVEWLRKRNIKTMRGPMNLSMNDECGFLLDGFDSPPVFMMPYNPEYYLRFMEKYGMTKAKDLFAYLNKGIVKTPERINKIAERARKKHNVKIRPVDFTHLNEEIKIIKKIYNAAWERNWGFVPMTDEAIDYMAANLKKIAVPELVLFAEVNDKPIGISVTVPNYNEVLIHLNGRLDPMNLIKFLYYRNKIKGLRSLIMGILPEYRLTEDNHLINKFDETIGGRLYKKYRIYQMDV